MGEWLRLSEGCPQGYKSSSMLYGKPLASLAGSEAAALPDAVPTYRKRGTP